MERGTKESKVAEVGADFSTREDRYLDLLKKCLTRFIFPDVYRPLLRPSREKHPFAWIFYPALATILERNGLSLYRHVRFDPVARSEGLDWPAEAETMIGLKRLDNLQSCIEAVIR